MAKQPEPPDTGAKQDEGWVEIGRRPAAAPVEPVAAPAARVVDDDADKPLAERQGTPPWKYSVYIAGAGLLLMLALYLFPDLRAFETPWDDEFPTAYSLLPFSVLGLVWGIIGVLGKRYRADAGRAAFGIVLSLAGLVVVFSGALMNPRTVESTPDTDPRLQMTPQELQRWRSEKLRQ